MSGLRKDVANSVSCFDVVLLESCTIFDRNRVAFPVQRHSIGELQSQKSRDRKNYANKGMLSLNMSAQNMATPQPPPRRRAYSVGVGQPRNAAAQINEAYPRRSLFNTATNYVSFLTFILFGFAGKVLYIFCIATTNYCEVMKRQFSFFILVIRVFFCM